MKMYSILVSILWIGLCYNSVSSYPADEDTVADQPKVPGLPPIIVTQPKAYVVSRDANVTLDCEVINADQESALVWNRNNHSAIYVDDKCYAGSKCSYYTANFRNNSADSKGSYSALNIIRVNEETAGNYFCTYRTVSIMHQVSLKVTIEMIMGPKSIEYGETLKLFCRVTGFPVPEVTWQRQANEASLPVGLGHGTNLTIEHVTSAHAGIYTCTALNFNNEPPVSKSLHVAVVKGIAALNPIVNAADGTGSVILCCNYGHSSEQTQIKWSKNGKDLPSDGRRIINKALKSRSCTTIMTVKEEDLGTYTCSLNKAIQDLNAPASAQIELTGIPMTPTVESVSVDSSKTPIMKWKVKTFSPLTNYVVRVKKQEQTDNDWLVQANKTISSNNREEIIEQSLDSISNGVYDVELVVTNKFGSARLVHNNGVAVDRVEHEVIAEKIKNGDGSGASRSIGISLFCLILGVILSKL